MSKPKRKYRKSRVTRPPMGWTGAAKKLAVSPAHLWLVVNGQRQSKTLLARYKALVAGGVAA
ncbi:hypothetical protein AYO49_05820 [Verrucomicrobiaceae bacterium SCGC AG-212-N21]|nr:hypothetical protein AYO49_05820 [Verrucomicrobiaceae bacterium SCGC AG-212-N21]